LAVQQELFENGLPSPDPTGYPRPGVDLTAAQASLDRYWPLVVRESSRCTSPCS
jgi:hypothetical protein